MRRSKGWHEDQKYFEGRIARRHEDARPFLASIRNAVAKQSFYKSRPKQLSKNLAGGVIGMTSASVDARKHFAYVEANRALLRVDDTLTREDLRLSWSDDLIRAWATNKAAVAARKIESGVSVESIKSYVLQYGFAWPQYDLFGESAALCRVVDERWWRRQARVAKARAIDQLARSFRVVHALAQPYASNEAVQLRRQQARRNKSVLEGFEAINQEGDSYTLAELSALSVSNPTNRRHELMVRIRGFEELADRFGHEGLFITMAAPSKFHPMRQIKNNRGRLLRVIPNKSYGNYGAKEFTPKEAQDWLCKTWALIRAELARKGIRCYGFRVVEPHHDGCPHWHQLLFFKKYDLAMAEQIYKRYMMREDGFEPGASSRIKIITIDRSKGTAAGYIAKYICKNIDGSHIDNDLLGNAGVEAAERICASTSIWGIRQFQQIGGPSVTVWRELRRLDGADGVVELARVAAGDASDWAAYCLVQGDEMPFFGRNEQAIRPAYWLEHDAITGEVIDEPLTRYGEQSPGRLFGVLLVQEGKHYLTRVYRWIVHRVGAVCKSLIKSVSSFKMTDEDLLDLLRGDGSGATA